MQILEIFTWIPGWESPYLTTATIHFTFKQSMKWFYFKCIFLKKPRNNNKKNRKNTIGILPHSVRVTQREIMNSVKFEEKLCLSSVIPGSYPPCRLMPVFSLAKRTCHTWWPGCRWDALRAQRCELQSSAAWPVLKSRVVKLFDSKSGGSQKTQTIVQWRNTDFLHSSSWKSYSPYSIIFPVLDHLVYHFLYRL